MKILQFIIGKGNKNRPNGVNQVISGHCKYLLKNGIDLKVLGYASNAKVQGETENQDGFEVKVFSKPTMRLVREILYQVKWCDIVHLHGVYNLHNIFVAFIARIYKTPYVITTHNGFSKKLSNLRKIIFDIIVQRNHINNADAIHVITPEESTEILKKMNPKSIFLAHNAIDFDDYNFDFKNNQKDRKVLKLGYLGRIGKEKNLENLMEAVKMVKSIFSIEFFIAGPETKYLKQILKKYSFVNWVGPKYSDKKIEFIKSLDLFIHPSVADVFSISAIEVLAIATTPLLITRTSKASYFYNSNGFYMCEPTVFGLFEGIKNSLNDKKNWDKTILNGRTLVNETLNWDYTSKKLIDGYKKVLKNKDNFE